MSTMSELDRVRKEQARLAEKAEVTYREHVRKELASLEAEAAYCEQALEDAKTFFQELPYK